MHFEKFLARTEESVSYPNPGFNAPAAVVGLVGESSRLLDVAEGYARGGRAETAIISEAGYALWYAGRVIMELRLRRNWADFLEIERQGNAEARKDPMPRTVRSDALEVLRLAGRIASISERITAGRSEQTREALREHAAVAMDAWLIMLARCLRQVDAHTGALESVAVNCLEFARVRAVEAAAREPAPAR